MTFGTLSDEDRRAERLRRLEESRAARNATARRPAPPTPPRPAPPMPRPAPPASQTSTPAFRIVDDVPQSRSFRHREIPRQRQELIDFAKANPGKWIEYPSTNEDPYKSPSSFVANVRQGRAGFAPKGAFEAVSRGKVVYVRYVGHSNGESL